MINKKLLTFLKRPKGINIDITHRCPLECPNCQRQTQYTNHGRKVPGYDLSLEEIDKLSNFFDRFDFCGQLSDPVHHPQFVEILKMLKRKKIKTTVHNAASARPIKYYIKCFNAYPEANWIFAIDGLPEESHKYRVNQNGKKIFQVMCESKKYLTNSPTWQYIVFSYNEYNIEKAKKMAFDNNLKFMVIKSSRWLSKDDPLMPISKEYRLKVKKK